jgi:hypothetical protein
MVSKRVAALTGAPVARLKLLLALRRKLKGVEQILVDRYRLNEERKWNEARAAIRQIVAALFVFAALGLRTVPPLSASKITD